MPELPCTQVRMEGVSPGSPQAGGSWVGIYYNGKAHEYMGEALMALLKSKLNSQLMSDGQIQAAYRSR